MRVKIESLDHEGRGIARHEGKVVFVEGALPGEDVSCTVTKRRPSYDLAQLERLHTASADRVAPGCRHFVICGGCSMQHLNARAQVATKQRVLEDSLWHIGRLRAESILPAIHGQDWGYRKRARLSARYVIKHDRVLVGFHERHSRYVVDMNSCEVLPPHVSALLPQLAALLTASPARERMPQIEYAGHDHGAVFVLRHLEPLSDDDLGRLAEFERQHDVRIWLQPAGPATVHPLHEDQADNPYYALPDYDVRLAFLPTDFTQVNHAVNRMLVRRAMQLLQPQPGERVADMFCGIGNFTLPIARSGAWVVGVEGRQELVERARANALANGLSNTDYQVADLFKLTNVQLADWGNFDKMLIDPPREGAVELIKCLTHVDVRRIVYVSCNPATLARDAGVLVHQHGYRLISAGVANMFTHTAHVESIALFDR